MLLYREAGKIIDKIVRRRGTTKQLVYNCSFSNKKILLALVSQTLRYLTVLTQLFELEEDQIQKQKKEEGKWRGKGKGKGKRGNEEEEEDEEGVKEGIKRRHPKLGEGELFAYVHDMILGKGIQGGGRFVVIIILILYYYECVNYVGKY